VTTAIFRKSSFLDRIFRAIARWKATDEEMKHVKLVGEQTDHFTNYRTQRQHLHGWMGSTYRSYISPNLALADRRIRKRGKPNTVNAQFVHESLVSWSQKRRLYDSVFKMPVYWSGRRFSTIEPVVFFGNAKLVFEIWTIQRGLQEGHFSTFKSSTFKPNHGRDSRP
jgi:hypothetical protein